MLFFWNRCFGNDGFECKGNKNAWISACLFANLSFFICLRASCFSEMAVSKVKMMELSELRSYSFLGSMHIVFHLQFNLPSSSFLLPMSVFDATMQLNGGGRNPEPYQLADGSQSWSPRFHSFGQVSAQITRWLAIRLASWKMARRSRRTLGRSVTWCNSCC